MQIKKFLSVKPCACILAGILVIAMAFPLSAQSRKTKRKKEIKVPETALACPYTKEDISAKINYINDWVITWKTVCDETSFEQLITASAATTKNPKSYRLSDLTFAAFMPRKQDDDDKKKGKKKEQKVSKVQIGVAVSEQKKAEGEFYYLTRNDFKKRYDSFGIFMRVPRLSDDMQEATQRSKDVFLNYDDKLKKLQVTIEKMDRIRSSASSQKALKAVFVNEFKPALNAVLAAYANLEKSKRMPYEARQALEERNRARRKEAYITKIKQEREQDQQEKQ